jgi:SAM-dependent methyltransferase
MEIGGGGMTVVTSGRKHVPTITLDYYTRRYPTPCGQDGESIYGIWERGAALNDSVTPASYDPKYRRHMGRTLMSLTNDGAMIFSAGCGNGFIEGDLVARGRSVRAVDLHDEAVELSRQKGVDAVVGDYFALRPADVAGADALYADGLLGHLFDRQEELRPVLDKLAGVGLKSGAYLVLSNDAPFDGSTGFEPHRNLEGFWYLSKDYLQECLVRFGMCVMQSYYFRYVRPISGIRNRTICVARIP